MGRSVACLVALVLSLAPGVASQEPLPSAAVVEGPAIDVEGLRAEIQQILEEEGIPGASVALVSRDRTIWAGGVGKADVAAGLDVTADHLFRVGSISKSFTALAVMRAVEDGLIDLEASVLTLVPEIDFTNRWAASHPVTVAHVMEHTTGFDDIRFRDYAKVDDSDISLVDGLAYNPSSRSTRWRPGTHMSYCNSGPAIAAYVLEKVTGQPFEAFAREQVFEPLGMTNSTFYFPENVSLMAKGYEADGVTEANYDHIIVRPSGALNASATEMARYLRMMINRGTLDGVQLLEPETITRMETPTTTLAARAGFDYGYGLGNYSSIVNGHLFHGHNGGITGFVSTSAYSSELGVGYFVSINRASGALRDLGKLLGERLTAGIDKPQGASSALEDSRLQALTGFYQDVTPRVQLAHFITRFLAIQRVTLEDGELFVKGLTGGEKKKLIPVTASSFRSDDEPVATVFSVIDEDGASILQGGGNNKKVSAFWVFFQLAGAMITLLLMLSAVLFALVWVPLKSLGRFKTIPLREVLVPLLATLSPLAAFVLPVMLSSDMTQDLGTFTGFSLAIYLGSLVFAALTAYSLYTSYRAYSVEMSRFVRLHSVLVSLACVVLLSYAWANDLIGLRTWAY